jgi:glycosyltransferase involved in cell wall biosynthesis
MGEIRVLHVIARMNVGGTATYLANLIRGLEGLGVKNLLAMGVVPKGEAEDRIVDSLPIVRVAELSREINPVADFKAYRNLKKVIAEFKPNLIHTHTFKAGLLLRLKRSDVPVVHSFHGHHLYDPEFGFVKRGVVNFLERRLAERSEALVTIGKRVRDELLEVGIGERSQFHPIAPGIAVPKVDGAPDRRAEVGISSSETVVMWLGRFTQVKRPDLVLEIAKALPEITFVMAGGGVLLESCRVKAPKNVKLVGFQNKDEMWKMADVGLCTSDSEGMPLSLIEAQMAGVPVVSTDVGSVAEIVVDGKTGKLAKDSSGLVEGIKWVKDSIEKSDELSKESKRHALENFTIDQVASAHLKLYKDVLDKVAR